MPCAHTPGPWQWWTSNSMKRLKGGPRDEHNVLHAYRCSDGVSDISVREEDMALIAAAPELLAVVDDAVRLVESGDIRDLSVFIAAARAAAAKARGL